MSRKFTTFLFLKGKFEQSSLQTETVSKHLSHNHRKKHRNDIPLNHIEVLEGTNAGVAVSSAFAEAGF